MKRTVLLGSLMALLLAPFAMAEAHSNVSVTFSTPDIGIRIGAPMYPAMPVYAPPPVYLPAPVYAPVPVYAPPPRVIYQAPVVVVPARRAIPAPVYYGRPGAWVAPAPYGYRHWDGWRDDRREYRRDGLRAGYGY
jgi:hypothetical protein